MQSPYCREITVPGLTRLRGFAVLTCVAGDGQGPPDRRRGRKANSLQFDMHTTGDEEIDTLVKSLAKAAGQGA